MNKNKIALITGVNGQDGSFLAEFLLSKNYIVHGMIRKSSSHNTDKIDHLLKNNHFKLHFGDLNDSSSITNLIGNIRPDEIYNLAAQSHVMVSFEIPIYTSDVDALGVLRILEAIRSLNLINKTKIYQASTSELFGKVTSKPQNENTPFHPYSPYAIAKQYAYWMIQEYREAYGIFACNGILFNHESERRGENFVTRKITLAAARIKEGLQDVLELGNLDSLRDWGYAKDYVECMWLMLQQNKPNDFIIATGKQHSVRDFATRAFKENGFDIKWSGKGLKEVGKDKKTGKVLIKVNPKYFSPTEVTNLLGDPSKAIKMLKWNPNKTTYEKLIKIMCDSDKRNARIEKYRKQHEQKI